METIYFDNGSVAFKSTDTNFIMVCYSKQMEKRIWEQTAYKEHYIRQYGSNRITKAEFDAKFEEVFTHLLNQ
jgi:hypothetical protein